MDKRLSLILCFFAFCICTASAEATMITYDYQLASDGTLTTPVSSSLAVVDTYDSGGRPGWDYINAGGTWGIVSGDLSGHYARPYNYVTDAPDSTNYFVVQTGSVLVDFKGTYNYLGLFWGSIDAGDSGIYNTIDFLKKDSLGNYNIVETWTGNQIIGGSGGSWTAPSDNMYVNFWDLQDFDAILISSNSPAFELDNLAVSLVPVPATILLGFLGLGVGGWKLRKTKI